MEAPNFYNEMLDADGAIRPHYEAYVRWLNDMPPGKINAKRAEADALFHRVGITFAVYGDEGGAERLIPFDIIPRIIPAAEWRLLSDGLRQRVAKKRRVHAFVSGQRFGKAHEDAAV